MVTLTFSESARASAAVLPQALLARVSSMLRAVAETAEELGRAGSASFQGDVLKLMLYTGGHRFDYLLDLRSRSVRVLSIGSALRDAG